MRSVFHFLVNENRTNTIYDLKWYKVIVKIKEKETELISSRTIVLVHSFNQRQIHGGVGISFEHIRWKRRTSKYFINPSSG